MDKLVIATHNPGKAREIADLLRGMVQEVITAGSLSLPEPDETETTFSGNALIKARAAAHAANLPALADDSGFCLAALGGDPGVLSARWAGPDKDFKLAMDKVHSAWTSQNTDNRAAHFICALALVYPDGREHVVEGRVDGTFTWPPRGENGFGYDPVFTPDGYDQTFGELAPDHKHAISHRADAFRQLKTLLGA